FVSYVIAGITDFFIKILFVHRHEDNFEHLCVRHAFCLQAKTFRITGPWFAKNLRIGKRERKLEIVPIQAAPALGYLQFVTEWHAPFVRSESWIQTLCFDNECVAVPFSDRISVTPGSRIFRHFAAVGPDFTPY